MVCHWHKRLRVDLSGMVLEKNWPIGIFFEILQQSKLVVEVNGDRDLIIPGRFC